MRFFYHLSTYTPSAAGGPDVKSNRRLREEETNESHEIVNRNP